MNIHKLKIRQTLPTLLIVFTFFQPTQLWAQNCTEMCDWYGMMKHPICQNEDFGFFWENGEVCIARATCENQSGASGVFKECEDTSDDTLCKNLDGRKYYTNQLFEMGFSPTGEMKGHRSLQFEDGELLALQSNFGIHGSYQCKDGQVIASFSGNDNYVINLSEDLNTLDFDYTGGRNPATYSLASDKNANCSLITDSYYELDPAQRAELTLLEGITYTVKFKPGRSAELYIDNIRFDQALYDCETGELHIHTSEFDSTPIAVDIENQGESILLSLNATTSWRFIRQELDICPTLYDPVCSADLNGYSCIDGPCPSGIYSTYPNRCVSNAANALFIEQGECGDREGKYYYEGGHFCTEQYEPVCSVNLQPIACITEPCPVGLYETYPNLCYSDSNGAMFVSEGKCGDKEGEPYYEGPCGNEQNPVCGIKTKSISCITGPCPNEFYHTYRNQCEAKLAGSPILFTGACGDEREESPYWGHSKACGADAEYHPLCALKTETHACTTTPCPKQTYRIYSNTCEMKYAGATFLHDDHCGPKTDSFVNDLSDYFNICPAIDAPVCAKDERISGDISSGYTYKSFDNSCKAEVAVADIAWDHQGCGAIEQVETGNEPTVRMVSELSPQRKQITVNKASIVFDTLKVDFSYSGCRTQHFDVEIERAFRESLPVQAQWALIAAVDDSCEAIITDTLTYDLLPLKALYQEAYGDGAATIALPGLGDYIIDGPAPEATLKVEHPDKAVVGEQITVFVEATHPANSRPRWPLTIMTTANGDKVSPNNSLGDMTPEGPPWHYWSKTQFTPEAAGEYTIEVQWQGEPQLNQSSIIAVVDDAPLSECEIKGIDMDTITEYPNWPARDWSGGPLNHANSGDYLQYQEKVFKARWYSNSTPGSDNSWEFVCHL